MGAVKQSRSPVSSLGAIVAHPLRTRIWTVLTERTASPNELKSILGATLGDVAYHVRVLKDVGLIELVDTKPRRGAVEHWYRSVERAFSDDEETAARSLENRTELANHICQLAFADASVALNELTFCERPDHCVTRFPLKVDEDGWKELNAAYTDLVERIFEVQANTAERASHGGTAEIKATALAMFFEMPAPPRSEPRPTEV